MKKKYLIIIAGCLVVVIVGLLISFILNNKLEDDGIDTGIVMGYCTVLPDQYGLVFTHTDKTLDKVKNAKLLKVMINDEEAKVTEVKDKTVFGDLSDFMGEKVLYYANLKNSFTYENDLDIVVFMEVTMKNGDKVTQKFTDKITVEGYGGF
ncbi:MAG: hypothetical protein ACM3O4_02520 [Ignavibacteriales bacterium]